MAKNIDISIIVAFDNAAPLQDNFFDGLVYANAFAPDREIIMASDHCVNTETIELTRKWATEIDDVIFVEAPKKLGYSKANNMGVAVSSGKYLLFMNTDVFAEPGAIEALRKVFDDDPDVGAVQGLLLYPQNNKVMCTGHTFNDYMNHHLYNGRAANADVVQIKAERQALNSAFLMMRRDVFFEMGGFDEFFFNAYDGMDLTMRAGQAGYKLIYEPAAIGWHSTGGSRDYIRHSNEYQSKFFYANRGGSIESDLVYYLRPQTDAIKKAPVYRAIDCTFCMTWKKMVRELGIKFNDVYEIPERDSSKVDLYRNVPSAILHDPTPIVFVVNHFADISANWRWFNIRRDMGMQDIVVDFFGNAGYIGTL